MLCPDIQKKLSRELPLFTGIVDHIAEITNISSTEQGLHFTIACQFADLLAGESISVDGACLTVVDPVKQQFCVDLSQETCDKTIANTYQVGSKVNVERAMRASDRFGGHYVTGHVEQVATVAGIAVVGDCWQMDINGILPAYHNYLVDKGSVCVNGVSLTINKVFAEGFQVMIIPHTLQRTNLSTCQSGSVVNIEFDWMVKVIIGKMKLCNV